MYLYKIQHAFRQIWLYTNPRIDPSYYAKLYHNYAVDPFSRSFYYQFKKLRLVAAKLFKPLVAWKQVDRGVYYLYF